MSSSAKRSFLAGSDRWMLVTIVAIIAVLAFAFYLLFEWAGDQSPWVLRVVLVLVATLAGFRLGQAGNQRPKGTRGPNWLPISLAAIGLMAAGWFGMIEPAKRDRERDQAFDRLIADGRTTTEALEAVVREIPEDERKMSLELREKNVEALHRAIDWMERYQKEIDRFNQVQQKQLHDEFNKMLQASTTAREKLARWSESGKKK